MLYSGRANFQQRLFLASNNCNRVDKILCLFLKFKVTFSCYLTYIFNLRKMKCLLSKDCTQQFNFLFAISIPIVDNYGSSQLPILYNSKLYLLPYHPSQFFYHPFSLLGRLLPVYPPFLSSWLSTTSYPL